MMHFVVHRQIAFGGPNHYNLSNKLGIISAENPQMAAAQLGIKIVWENAQQDYYSTRVWPDPSRQMGKEESFIWMLRLPALASAGDLALELQREDRTLLKWYDR